MKSPLFPVVNAEERPLTNRLIPIVLFKIDELSTEIHQYLEEYSSIGDLFTYLLVCMYYDKKPEEKWLVKAKVEFEKFIKESEFKDEFLVLKACFELVGFFESTPISVHGNLHSIVETFYNVKNDANKMATIGSLYIFLFFNQFRRSGLSSEASSLAKQGFEYLTYSTYFDMEEMDNLESIMIRVFGCYLRYPDFTENLDIMNKIVYSISSTFNRSNLSYELDKEILRLLPCRKNNSSFKQLCKWRFIVSDEIDSLQIEEKAQNEIMKMLVNLHTDTISIEEIGALLIKLTSLNYEWKFRIAFSLWSAYELDNIQKELVGTVIFQNIGLYLDNIDIEGVLIVLSALDDVSTLLKEDDIRVELVHLHYSNIREKFDNHEWLDNYSSAEYYSKMFMISKVLFMASKDDEIGQREQDMDRYRDLCHQSMP